MTRSTACSSCRAPLWAVRDEKQVSAPASAGQTAQVHDAYFRPQPARPGDRVPTISAPWGGGGRIAALILRSTTTCNASHQRLRRTITTPTRHLSAGPGNPADINREWGWRRTNHESGPYNSSRVYRPWSRHAVLNLIRRDHHRWRAADGTATSGQDTRKRVLLYERARTTADLPIIGVNTFRNPAGERSGQNRTGALVLEEEKKPLRRLADFHSATGRSAREWLRRCGSE